MRSMVTEVWHFVAFNGLAIGCAGAVSHGDYGFATWTAFMALFNLKMLTGSVAQVVPK